MIIILTTVVKNPLEEKSLKYSTWVHPQKWQNDPGSFQRQTIQRHSNPSLCLNHGEEWLKKLKNQWRNSSVLWRPTRPSRTNTKKWCPFHRRGLGCKSRKSRDQNNRQVWPWSTKWSRAKANEFCQENMLVTANILFQQPKRWLYT